MFGHVQRLPDQAHAVNDFLLTEVNRLDRSVMLFENERVCIV